MSQRTAILHHLKAGRAITDMQALNLFRCRRLAARIWEIKREGVPVKSELRLMPSGVTVAVYSL